jgi:hypothetical protein
LGRSEVQLGERRNNHWGGGEGTTVGEELSTVREEKEAPKGWRGEGNTPGKELSTVIEKKEPPQGWGRGEGNTVGEELSTVEGGGN